MDFGLKMGDLRGSDFAILLCDKKWALRLDRRFDIHVRYSLPILISPKLLKLISYSFIIQDLYIVYLGF